MGPSVPSVQEVTDVRKQLAREILDHFPASAPVLSLYSDTDRSRRAPREIALSLKNLFRESQTHLSEWDTDSREKVKSVLEEFLPRIENAVQPFPPGWALYISPMTEPLVFPLPVVVADGCDVGQGPRLFPLVQAVGAFKETLVVLFENSEVRFFRKRGSRLDLLETLPEDVPARIKAGGRYGMDERRIERHSREERERVLADISAKVRVLFDKKPYDRLLVSGSKELAPRLLERIRQELPSVDADLVPEVPGPGSGLELRLNRWAMGRFWEEGESLVGRIQTESSKGGLAAWGWRATLAASNAGAVHQMVFEEYEQTRGVRCPACGALGMDEKTCPACGAETLPEEDLMEALLQRTIRQDGDVVILGRPSLLREKAGVGAILRFPL